jgi:hypothetical protein
VLLINVQRRHLQLIRSRKTTILNFAVLVICFTKRDNIY